MNLPRWLISTAWSVIWIFSIEVILPKYLTCVSNSCINVRWTINAANHLHVFSSTSHTLPQMNHAKLGNEIMSVSSDNVAAAVIYSL